MLVNVVFGLLLSSVLICVLIRLFMKCSIKRCTSNTRMKGKVVIITGANTGLGYYAALDIARRGGKVILACRNEKKGMMAREQIINESRNKDVVFKRLNLSSLKSVREFAEDVKNNVERLDVLVNNAGVHISNDDFTADGILEAIQINHFAPFLLTILLLPMLKKTQGRIVNVSSICLFRGEINLSKINKQKAYDGDKSYANGKLCNLIFTKELASRLEGTGVTVNALHPGVILTNIVEQESISTRLLFRIWCWFCCRTAEEGAQTTIYLSVADEVRGVTGKFFIDCKERSVFWKARNKKLAKNLWEYSVKLVGLTREEYPVFLY